jgi:peptide/nickel transport system substrate-binding protein
LKSKLIISALLTLTVLLSANTLPAFAQIQHGGTLTLALPNTIDNFSQFLTTSYQAWYFNQMVYPNFGIPLPTGVLHVAVSDYWSNTKADTWYFQVRPGMTWSDGVPVNATDVAYSIKLMLSSYPWGAGSLSSYQQFLAGSVDSSVKVVNATTVEIDLKQPLGTFGDTVGAENSPNLSPYHIWNKYINASTAPGPNFGTLVGSGAYYVSNFHQGDTQAVLLPNPYGSPFGGDSSGKPYLNQINVQLVPTSSDTSFLLKGGQIDAAPVAPSDVAGLTSDPRFKAVYGPTSDTWLIEYPIWAFPYNMSDFRKALAYSINRTDLVQTAYAGYAEPGNPGYLPPSNSPDFNPNVPAYNYDPAKAQQLLSGLGWTKHSDGFYYLPDGSAFTPTIYAPAENQPIVTAANRIAQYLKTVGINAKAQSIALTSMITIWDKGNNMWFYEQNYGYPWSALLFDYSFDGYGSAPPLMHPVFWPTSVETQYNNTLAQLNAEGTASGRSQYMQKLQSMIAENLPSITLFYVDSVWVYSTEHFGGWPTPPSTLDWPGGEFNQTALASIYSLSAQPASTSSSMASSTSTSAPSTSDNTPLLIGGAIVVIALVGIGFYARARRKRA